MRQWRGPRITAAGSVAAAILMVACAPEPPQGPGATTTTSTTSTTTTSTTTTLPTDPGSAETHRISIGAAGLESDDDSHWPALSADGRYVAFFSSASNLVDGDTNGKADIFVYDRQSASMERVSVSSDGKQSNGGSYNPSISADGRFVAFGSHATNLVAGDTNDSSDIFVHDRQNGTTRRVSVASDGTQSEGGHSNSARISADGRIVAFDSYAFNLVPNDTNGTSDVFVHDLTTGSTSRVSVASDGSEGDYLSMGPALSDDGRYVAFYSAAGNLVDNDENGLLDVFVHDRVSGETSRVSVASDGTEADDESVTGSISADGRYVAFRSIASNLVPDDTNFGAREIFVHDRETGETTRVSVASDGTQADGWSFAPSISADGRYVAFESNSTNLFDEVDDDINWIANIFVHDRQNGVTRRVSVPHDGSIIDGDSSWAAISADGKYVAYESVASNLVEGDLNGLRDIFITGPLW